MSVSELPLVYDWINKPGKLLEIGGKTGNKNYIPYHIREQLIKKGHDYYGIDKNDNIPELNVQQCDIEKKKLPFDDFTFDYVILMHVLEHLGRNPVFALEEMFRVLKYSGLLIVTTPNFFNLTNMWLLISKGKQQGFDSIIEDYEKETGYTGHIRVYTKKEAIKLLEHVGFDLIKFRFMHRRDTFMVVGKKTMR